MSDTIVRGWTTEQTPEGVHRASKTFKVRNGQVTLTVQSTTERLLADAVADAEMRMEPMDYPGMSLKDFVRKCLCETVAMSETVKMTQDRSSVLIQKSRAMRVQIIELGGEDPGQP